jgi:nitronate monooxygenase
VTRDAFDRAAAALLPLYRECGVDPPVFQPRRPTNVGDQIDAVIDLRVPVFSFVFGVPEPAVLAECRKRGIVTVGAATAVDEAVAVEAAGVDLVVASGLEAGGHRPSFLRSAESRLTGLFALVPQVVDAVRIPVIAAGGIADGRTVAAALTLGASGVQVGTAFLACEESNATPGHRAALFGPSRHDTVLTRAFTGRLARGIRNRLAKHLESFPIDLPFPLPGDVLAPLRRAALSRDESEMMSLWAGQAAPLLRHHRAKDVFDALVSETDAILRPRGL